jgi:hypothetical protein
MDLPKIQQQQKSPTTYTTDPLKLQQELLDSSKIQKKCESTKNTSDPTRNTNYSRGSTKNTINLPKIPHKKVLPERKALLEQVQRDHALFVFMAISCEPGLELGEPLAEGEDDAASMATSGESGPEARGEKAQGTMVGGSPIGDDASGQLSPAAKVD